LAVIVIFRSKRVFTKASLLNKAENLLNVREKYIFGSFNPRLVEMYKHFLKLGPSMNFRMKSQLHIGFQFDLNKSAFT